MSNTATAEKTTADTGTDWAALLNAAQLDDAKVRVKRATVDVPPAVLSLVEKAKADGKRITLPYDAAKYSELCDVFYSAGDLLTPQASVAIVRIKVEDGKPVVLKAKDSDEGVTHVRISVTERRGQKGKKEDKPVEATAGDPKNDA